MTDLVARLRSVLGERVSQDVPLGPFTTFRVGGPADVFVEAESVEDLVTVATHVGDEPIVVVGRGSNMLVADDGFRGLAVRLGRGLRTHEVTEAVMRLGGAVSLPAAARLTARHGLAGFEFAAEIPGSFGGAVRMNAGAHGREMADVLVDVDVVDLRTGEATTMPADHLGLAYRSSTLPVDAVVTGGRIGLTRGDPDVIGTTIADHLRWRRDHQPPGRSAGSVFKNPAGDSAGRLVDAAGLKGHRVGGAVISEVHANFIVTRPEATADDVAALIRLAGDRVRERTGVTLEPEVRVVGTIDGLS